MAEQPHRPHLDANSSISVSVRDISVEKERVKDATLDLSAYQTPLTSSDVAMVMQGWNKVLAFRTSFSEALLFHWRLSCALESPNVQNIRSKAVAAAENNQDPIALALMERLWDAEDLLMGLLDGAFRSLCPENQTVQREAYRPVQDYCTLGKARGQELRLECETVPDYVQLFARCGVLPGQWVLFMHSFAWALQTHAPYAQQADAEDLERGTDSAFRRAVAQVVAMPGIQAYATLKGMAQDPVFAVAVPRFWAKLDQKSKHSFGEHFYRTLLAKHGGLLDYFARTDMDSLAVHLMQTLDFVVSSVAQLGDCTGSFRQSLNMLGEMHRRMGIPTYAYLLVGLNLLECLKPLFEAEEEATADEEVSVTATQLRTAFLNLYKEVMSLVYYPMLKQEKMLAQATEFFELIRDELNWPERRFKQRILQVEEEIVATGTYTHTSQELELGARLAWRNSAKCIGRISWNTLQVRDCRHIDEPAKIFKEAENHLKLATAGTNIQSIMTVFKPQSPSEPFGTRFWSSQYVRYAAYEQKTDDGGKAKILGDPANLEITNYLLENDFWKPPEPKTPFDVLPLVLKVPGQERPHIHQLPQDCVFEVPLEHPTLPAISALNLRWTTVPAISNFKMNLGGVVYQNIPFNGWFMSTEIVRNLMERYGCDVSCAEALGLDINTDPMWRQAAACELERAVLHSFQKHGFTIVDPMTVGQSFCSHVRREREKFGRECPGQWSWIGGLVGPTNPTWHLEMRDFLVNPQYEYCAEGLTVYSSLSGMNAVADGAPTTPHEIERSSSFEAASLEAPAAKTSIPRVLIAYGSETGNAEAVARRLKRHLMLLKPKLMSLNEVKGLSVVKKRNLSHVLCVCSTFGKGEAPTNAADFFETDIEPGVEAKFAILALGSTIYPDFCQAGITLHKKLSDAGLDQLAGLMKADVAAGADGVIHDWLHLVANVVLPPSLEQEIMSTMDAVSMEPPTNHFKWIGETGAAASTGVGEGWLCLANTELLGNHSETRSTRRITFQLPPGEQYESGDHLAVQPLNSDKMVKRFFSCFKTELVSTARKSGCPDDSSEDAALEWQTQQVFELETVEAGERSPADVAFNNPATLHGIVTSKLDLSLSKNVVDLLKVVKRFLDRFLSTLDASKGERDVVLQHELVEQFLGLATPILNGTADEKTGMIDDLISEFPTIVGFLEHFQELFLEDFASHLLGWQPQDPILSLAEVIAILPKLQPRYYSISSSNRVNPQEVSLSVGLLRTQTSRKVDIEGVCSHYLCGLKSGTDRVRASVRKSTFRLPTAVDAPLLMVGAGTGLAPMLGFMEDRALDRSEGKTIGDVHLFFGCRTQAEFIYKDTIHDYEQSNLIQLHLGLSREPDVPKKYVQHRLHDMGKELCDLLLRKDTHYYVCGDARMADECFEACIGVLRKHAVLSRVSAVHHLKRMRLEGRWQMDVWGIVSDFETAKKVIEKSKRAAAKIWLSHFDASED